MSLVLPSNGESDALAYIVNKATPENLVLRLFKNDVTPAETDVAESYLEATFAGYVAATLTGSNWIVVEGAPSSASYPQHMFISRANQPAENIYGYYLTRASSGRIAWAERFPDGPRPITNLNDAIKITPVLELRTLPARRA